MDAHWDDSFIILAIKENMYLFLSSSDCQDSHPGNHSWDFTIDLKKFIQLKGEWECGLVDVDYTGPFGDLYVFSDLCSDSYVCNNYLPLLRIINNSQTFTKPYFIDVSRDFVDHIRVYIRTKDGRIPSFTPEVLRCALELRQKYVRH